MQADEKDKREDAVDEHHRQQRVREMRAAEQRSDERRYASEVGVYAQEERKRHRQETHAMARQQQEQARVMAARVRYETRPELRSEPREYFQAQRDAACRAERERQRADQKRKQSNQVEFLARAFERVANAFMVDEAAAEARPRLLLARRVEAEELRQHLNAERLRAKEMEVCAQIDVKAKHDRMIGERHDPYASSVGSSVAPVRTQHDLRNNLRARSRATALVL